jgi:histone H3/H4
MVDLVVKSKIREAVDCNVSSSVAEALNEKVQGILSAAEERVRANGRKTLMPHDL